MNPLRLIPLAAATGALLFAAPVLHAAPILITGTGGATQEFDTLISTGTATWSDDSTILGWYAQRSGTGTNIAAGTGSNDNANLYSYGASGNSERALGSIGSGSATMGNFALGVHLQNTTAIPAKINLLAFTGEQWRKSGVTIPQVVTLWYKVNGTAITSLDPGVDTGWTAIVAGDFSSPVNTSGAGALDGNSAANRTAISIDPNINIPPGQFAMIRWSDPDHLGVTDHGLAIDDVSLTWVPDTTPVLAVSALPTTFAENAGAGASTGTVTIPAALGANLTVTLGSSDPSSATVPASVVILAGQTSQDFAINAVDDTEPDGNHTVTIFASAPGYSEGTTDFTVNDDGDTAALATLSPGAIAITGINADGNDDLAFVALVPIAETDKIIFTDNEWNGQPIGSGGAFSDTNEGVVTWTPPAGGVAAGTVVTLNGFGATGRTASQGTLTNSGDLNVGGGETVYAYQGGLAIATGFVAAVTTSDVETFAGTGLGTSHRVVLPEDIDIAAFNGLRNNQSTFAGYLVTIGNVAANWITQDGSGSQHNDLVAPEVPFSSAAFTLSGDYGTWASATGAVEGASGDDDDDGKDNNFEYSFGLNPTAGGSVNPFVAPLDKTSGLFSYTRRKVSLTGVVFTYQSSTTLSGAWTSFTPDSTMTNSGDPVETITIDVPNALLAEPKLFIRVVAE